jgi:rare lipoprotein A
VARFSHALAGYDGAHTARAGARLSTAARSRPGTAPGSTATSSAAAGGSVRVRVIDRGPYVGAREFDLTRATKDRIGFAGHGTVLVSH